MVFDMHVRRHIDYSSEIPEGFPMPRQETQLEIWEVRPGL